VVAGEEDTVRNANARDVRSPTSSPSPRNTYGVYVFYHVYVYVVGMYTNVSDAFDRAGHGHKQLCIGLAPSRCDVIKREDSRWTSSAVQIPREKERERGSPRRGLRARNIEMKRRPRDISASHGGRMRTWLWNLRIP